MSKPVTNQAVKREADGSLTLSWETIQVLTPDTVTQAILHQEQQLKGLQQQIAQLTEKETALIDMIAQMKKAQVGL